MYYRQKIAFEITFYYTVKKFMTYHC